MSEVSNEALLKIVAEMQLKLASLEAEKLAAETAKAEAEKRKAEAAANSGYVSGTHFFGFPCLVPESADVSSPYHKFRLNRPLIFLRDAEESADGKTVYGPELLVLPVNKELSWSAGGPKLPTLTGSYLSASSGSSSSKYDPASGLSGTQIGQLLMLTPHVQGNPDFRIGADAIAEASEFCVQATKILADWFSELSPIGGAAEKRKSRFTRR